jgi:hypothetical protein
LPPRRRNLGARTIIKNPGQSAEDELTALALEGLDSGEPIEVGPEYWEARHQELDQRLRGTSGQ